VTTEPTDDRPTDEPGSDGVLGEQPNDTEGTDAAPLDESPDGQTPSDTTRSSADSLPPKLL
jgi:hypothetical protein